MTDASGAVVATEVVPLDMAAAAARTTSHWEALLALAALSDDGASWRAEALWRLGRLGDLADHLDAVGWDLAFAGRPEALVDLHLHLGNPARALWWLHGAQEPATAISLAQVANAFAARGFRAAWSRVVDHIVERIRDGDPPTGAELGKVLDRAVRWHHPAAPPLAEARSRSVPESPWSWWWVARARASVGDDQKALEAVDIALTIDGDFDPAKQLATLLARVDPDRPPVGEDVHDATAETGDGGSPERIHRLVREGDYTRAIEAGTRMVAEAPSTEVLAAIDVARRRLSDLTPIRRSREQAKGYRPVAGRVLHLVGRALPTTQSGYTIRTRSIIEAQAAAGLEPVLMSGPGVPWGHLPGLHRVEESIDGAVLARSPGLESHFARGAAIVRRHRPGLLHAASDFRNALVALDLREVFSIPVVYEVRGLWEETWLSRQGPGAEEHDAFRLRREIETRCMLEADALVTLSETLKRELESRGIPSERITVVPNAVDTNRFAPRPFPTALATRLAIPAGAVVVGCITSVVGYEGLPLLVEAVAELRRGGSQVVGLIVGDGPDRQALEALASSLGVGDAMRFTGRVPHGEVADHYALLDVFVLPRTNDRVCHLVTPLKPFEAMAMGRPLVVSDVAPLAEIIEENGLSFEPGDLDGLVAALRMVVDDTALRHRLGSNAAATARRSHTWRANGDRYLDLYRRLGLL